MLPLGYAAPQSYFVLFSKFKFPSNAKLKSIQNSDYSMKCLLFMFESLLLGSHFH